MADVILVQPIANRFDKVTTRVPNGLLAIAALPEKSGYSVRIIDCRIDDNWRRTLKDSIDDKTVCVGITCSTGKMIFSATEIAGAVRLLNTKLPIVWGGPHPTLMPEQTLKSPLVDIIVINEGDTTFKELIDALAKNADLSGIKGIGYKDSGKIKINPPAPLIKDLDLLLALPYHLVEISRYSSLTIDNVPSLDIVSSRGCPNNCAFCSTPVTSSRLWRAESIERVVENIKFLKERYGIGTFYLVDDNFMVDLKRVERFLDALKEANLKIHWGTQGVCVDTINKMSPEFLDRLEESGCVELSIGVESANPEILTMINKKFRIADVFAASEKLVGKRFAVKFNMIIGFPGETIDGIKKTVALAIELYKRNRHVWFPFNIFTPFPGTLMFQKALEYGFNQPANLEEWARLESTGWGRYFNHWMTKKENRLLESINCTSYLAFPLAINRVSKKTLKLLMSLYQPIAYLRFKHMFYFMHFEKLFLQRMD